MNQRALSSYEYRLQDFPAVAMSAIPSVPVGTTPMPIASHSLPSARVLLTAVVFSLAGWAGLAWLTLATIHLVR